ncbi:MAG: hypothetical protein AB7I24_14515 [Candidatus Nanopelagicales bacterium]|jgi:hypothetical protein
MSEQPLDEVDEAAGAATDQADGAEDAPLEMDGSGPMEVTDDEA